jgi:hypothetical protein
VLLFKLFVCTGVLVPGSCRSPKCHGPIPHIDETKVGKLYQLDVTTVRYDEGITPISTEVDDDNRTFFGCGFAKLGEWDSTKKILEVRDLSDTIDKGLPFSSKSVMVLDHVLGTKSRPVEVKECMMLEHFTGIVQLIG